MSRGEGGVTDLGIILKKSVFGRFRLYKYSSLIEQSILSEGTLLILQLDTEKSHIKELADCIFFENFPSQFSPRR